MNGDTSRTIRILAVDDNEEALLALVEILKDQEYEVITASSGHETLTRVADSSPDIILLDVQMPGPDGYEVTRTLKKDERYRYIPIILLTAKDEQEDIVEGFNAGADDYVKKPFQAKELFARINAALRSRRTYSELKETIQENATLRRLTSDRFNFSNIIGKSEPMQDVFRVVETIREASAPVLVTGESGTGKELVAHAIHYSSNRSDGPFVAVNCSAFNENLLESELFGHVKGSFTGAIKDKVGLFQAAHMGTLFLDELGEMPQSLQVKLLRVLQDGSFIPVGDTKSRKVDVRVIGATNKDIKRMVAEGSFREDLFYRLNVVSIELPPLRERISDIPLLADAFLQSATKRNNVKIQKRLAPETLTVLTQYKWPGNVRQLQNEIERIVIMSGKEEFIAPTFLSPELKSKGEGVPFLSGSGKLKDAVSQLERSMIQAALERTKGNKSEVSRELGISRSNLISKVQEYGLEE